MKTIPLLLALTFASLAGMTRADSGSTPNQAREKPVAPPVTPAKEKADKDSCCDDSDKDSDSKAKNSVTQNDQAKSAKKPEADKTKG